LRHEVVVILLQTSLILKAISILLPAGDAVVGSIEGPFKVLNSVNEILQSQGQPPAFDVKLVGLSKDTTFNNGVFTLHAHYTIDQNFKTDLVIIPAPAGDFAQTLRLNQPYYPWLIKQYKQGSEIASLCVGAFLLASTGLLDGRRCATHWVASDAFRQFFPEVTLVPEKIILDENGIYSSGGAFSYLNLILYLVEKFVSRSMAVTIAKIFEIELDRGSQSQFIIFNGQKNHEDDSIRKAQEYIEKNYEKRITVDELASMLALSRRNLERRFKKATSNTTIEYIQRVKIEAAKQSLERSRENVNEVMYKVGYTDSKAFRDTFRKITGLSPIQYKTRYSKAVL
jgi:transcriptional regulator GlxA family with amidase domain